MSDDAGRRGVSLDVEAAALRQAMVEAGVPAADLAADQGPTWDTEALQADFEVIGFAAPFVVVRRKADGVKGTLEFVSHPRVYFGFREDV